MIMLIVRYLLSISLGVGVMALVYPPWVQYIKGPIKMKRKEEQNRLKVLKFDVKHLSVVARQKKDSLFYKAYLRRSVQISKLLFRLLGKFSDIHLVEMAQETPKVKKVSRVLGTPLSPMKKVTVTRFVFKFLGEYRNLYRFFRTVQRTEKGIIWKKIWMRTMNYPNVLTFVRIEIVSRV